MLLPCEQEKFHNKNRPYTVTCDIGDLSIIYDQGDFLSVYIRTSKIWFAVRVYFSQIFYSKNQFSAFPIIES